MGSSMHLDSALVGELAERIGHARKLYGNDSPYVIGLITAFEWLAQDVEGGDGLKRDLLAQIVDADGSKAPQRPVRDHGKASVETDLGSAESAPLPEQGALTENSWIKGIVKWFNNDKGYGFISTDSNIDVFVHWRDISSWDRSLAQGDEVEFMITRTAKGYQAINVMKAGEESGAGQEEAGAGQTIAADAESAGEEAPVAEPTTEVGSPPTIEDESATTGSSDSEEGIS